MSDKTREFAFTRKDFDFLRKIANQRTGIVVTDEKMDMFYSRLSRRVRKLGLRDFQEYCSLIKNDKGDTEVLELVNAITTNLTAFFRENHHFEFLDKTAFPDIEQRHGFSRATRIWSAGCSTGEEPYSLAMTALEHRAKARRGEFSILATDIDSNVLQKAATGIYPMERVKGMQSPKLKRWFMRGKGGNQGLVKVKSEARRMINFGQLNLMENWRNDELMDVIFCRNVIIYFDKASKTKLVDRYADALVDGGYLFIGHSESLFKISDRFELIGNTIYQKKW